MTIGGEHGIPVFESHSKKLKVGRKKSFQSRLRGVAEEGEGEKVGEGAGGLEEGEGVGERRSRERNKKEKEREADWGV